MASLRLSLSVASLDSVRIRASLILLILTISASACPPAQAQGPQRPEAFHFRIGGFFGTTFEVELKGDALEYRTIVQSGKTKPTVVTVRPSPAAWRVFHQRCESIGVWRWKTAYPNGALVSDGTQWSLRLRHGRRSLETYGDNNFPTLDGSPNSLPIRTPEFKAFLDALGVLLGGVELG